MIAITEKTLQDLQFPTVLETLSDICNTDIGKEKALKITPFKEKEIVCAQQQSHAVGYFWSPVTSRV